jgi:hypothetical protein
MVPLPIAGVFGSFAYNVTMTIGAAALVRPLILHRPRNCMCRCYSCSQLWVFLSSSQLRSNNGAQRWNHLACRDAAMQYFELGGWRHGSVAPIFLCGFKVKWHTLSRWFVNVEIDVCLLVAFGVLLSPQYQQERRKLRKDNLRLVDLRVTPRTESDHQMQNRLARLPMVDTRIGITTHPTGVSIAL